eukprot:CAMPEP_0178459912 /NCGR_PEP_ID=MMETSP0689_2-20121128/48397_1 /TAXON_ID=160604 /ORGANISM="Amphidinium massartii, Strain CS-259" /LENGTH=37 /DNA_ID= /DNA_START= /DNA_END= /DNA_ORIENTATION=
MPHCRGRATEGRASLAANTAPHAVLPAASPAKPHSQQ